MRTGKTNTLRRDIVDPSRTEAVIRSGLVGTRDDIVAALEAEKARAGGLSLSKIARKADLQTSTVTRLLKPDGVNQVSLETLEKIATVLGLEIVVRKARKSPKK